MDACFENPVRKPRTGAMATAGVGGAILLSLALFGLLGSMQRTGDKGEKVAKSISFQLPEAPPEVKSPPPPPPQRSARARPPQRKPRAPQNAPAEARRPARTLSAAGSGVPRSLKGMGVAIETPAFDFGDAMALDASGSTGEAMSNFNTLLQRAARESARQLERRRGGSGGASSLGGVRPPEPISTPFEGRDYPADMLNAGVECLAVTEVVVSKDGRVVDVNVVELQPLPGEECSGDGFEKWKKSVSDTLGKVSRTWRFRAALDRASNLPIEDCLTINILFEISA